MFEGASLAYLAVRHFDRGPSELGAIGHGPVGAELAERICRQIRAWDRDRAAEPAITACPAGTADDELPEGQVIAKRHIRLVISS